MTHSALTNQIRLTPRQKSSRKGRRIGYVQLHHQASTNDDSTINMMQTGSRQVSANYTCSNEGRLTLVVDEAERAWTSGSPVDDEVAITVEIENEAAGPSWRVSDAAHEKVAQLVADVATRYGFPINRERVYGHKELYTRHRRSYATACPGGVDLDRIVRRALELQRGTKPAATAPAAAPSPTPIAPPFPLPGGWYFGPQSGPRESVSGYHGNGEHLATWQRRMAARGWQITPDGRYGPQTARVARDFQREKGLAVDELIGAATWAAAWTSPVT